MAFDYTTTALLASIKRREMLPDTAEALATADYLSLADEELQTFMVPLIVRTREEYFVTSEDTTITADTANYVIPQRAVGGKLRDLLLVDSNSNSYNLSRIEPEHRLYNDDNATADRPWAYYFRAGEVYLYPTPSTADTLRFEYFKRPNKLVQTSACDTVAAGSTGTTLNRTGTNLGTNLSTTTYEIVEHTPPFRSAETTVASGSGANYVVSAALPSWVTTGNYICVRYESPIPQIPYDMHPILAQRVAYKSLQALNQAGVDDAKRTLDEMVNASITVVTPRDTSTSRPIVNRYAPGWFKGRS